MNALIPARDFSPALSGEIMETVLIKGDLRFLNSAQRLEYCAAICQSVGLNPLTKPFEYIELNGKLTLYALKACTDQLRQIHGVSISILSHDLDGDLYSVHVKAKNREGRDDEDFGVVYMAYPRRIKKNGNWIDHPKAGQPLEAEDRANAILKAVTKAKRRVTLSICGLGMLDETEVEDIPASAKREATDKHADADDIHGLTADNSDPGVNPPSPVSLSPKKPTRKRKDIGREADPRYEAIIKADQPRRAFDRPAAPDPDAEREDWEAEQRNEEFLRMEHEIQSLPTLDALNRWVGDNHARIAQFSDGEKNGLRMAYANKKASLQPHSISQRAKEARGPRYARPPADDGLEIPDYLRRNPTPA